ncbi:hypothetical protein [Aquamicrobium sp. LC103]|uniref:hypothetical protein n=1 Tax=Aquamicrobium sp. LC103 TaxID=1120658 RepID=UPI00063E9A90|nr:hypothetical protein [Aquamicrobium sp. LC103]TKT76147.1 hypothetical protein XW59_016340 [Aquamicrobium sp. LC103]
MQEIARKAKVPRSSQPVSVRLEKNPSVCLVYDVYDEKGRLVPRREMMERYLQEDRGAFRRRTLRSAAGSKLCADGDSWINILWPLSAALGHHRTFFDVLQERYRTTDVAYPGDTFQQMLAEKDYRQPIQSGIFDFFIFSGGGNDVLGGGALVELLRWKADGGGSTDPKKYLFTTLLKQTLDRLRDGYMEIADDVRAKSSGRTRMLVHGYDYPIPRGDGVWIGRPFQSRGYDLRTDKQLIAAILKHLVDRFHSMLDTVQRRKRNVTLVDLRGICNGRWNDELHPKLAASRDFALRFREILDGGGVA